jgi:hypothetical protein
MLRIILGIHGAAKRFGCTTRWLYPIVAEGLPSQSGITAARGTGAG